MYDQGVGGSIHLYDMCQFFKYKILKNLEKQVSLIVCLAKFFLVFLGCQLKKKLNESNPSIILPKKIFVFLIN